ncbi:MAG: DUF2141 domain-containing protein [Alphaproteobacteria bacterium]|nr:DUF2141 domain-containing protein [Alphaproteobacteria bacterium]
MLTHSADGSWIRCDFNNRHNGVAYSFELPDGIYAIGVYLDVNFNNKLDKNFFGIPSEPYGFSNNAKAFLRSPSFEKASFVIAGNTRLSIDM